MNTFSHKFRQHLQGLVLIPALLLGLLSIVATGGGGGEGGPGGGGKPPTTGQVTVTGVVSGSGGLPDVTVSAAGKSTATDDNGFYELTDVPVADDGQLVLTYEKAGYATFQQSLPVVDGETYSVAASLLRYHFKETVDAAQASDLTVADPTDVTGPALAELSFPAGSLAASGNVTVEVAVGDPTTEAGRPTFPGNYMAASTAGGEVDTPLESVVFTEVTVTDASGKELSQLNEPATVTVRLPDALQGAYTAGDSIAWWSYDENSATWVREDADPATPSLDDALVVSLNGMLYAQAKVTHFTWWNVDHPVTEHACLCVDVIGDNDRPAVGARVIAEGVTYNGMSRPVRVGDDGRACVTIKRSTPAVTERVRLYTESGDVRFPYDVTDAAEGIVERDEIFTPTTQGSTVYNTGQCVDLANDIQQRFDGVVTGTVTYELSGNPVAGFTLLSSFGPTAVTDADGTYSINVPVGVPVSLFAVGLVSQTVTVTDAATPVTVDFVVPNRAPEITGLTRTPEGNVTSGQKVTLTVTARDPEGGALSYAWSSTAGSFSSNDAASVEWTAPAGSGTAEITVVVSDEAGAQTSRTVSIVYTQGGQGGNRLSLVIKDEPRSDQPVSGVTVALYNADDKTIAQTKTSNASGEVDFGDIGRSRATLTIAYEGSMGERYIETFVDVPVVENMVYYLDDGSEPNYGNVTNPLATIDITLSNDPANAAYAQVQPLPLALRDYGTGFENLTGLPVGDVHLQDDGKLSLLALVYSDTNWTSLAGYGFLLDQAVTDGASYDIDLGRQPLNLGWSTSPVTNLQLLKVSGKRSGVTYDLSPQLASPGSSGSIHVAHEFPVDAYWIEAHASSGADTLLTVEERHDTLPQSVQVTLPDYNFDSLAYNDANGTFSWQLSGSSPRDLLVVSMAAYSITEQRTEWSVFLAETATDWQVIELPAPADSWIDTTKVPQSVSVAYVTTCDVDFANGRDELWQFFVAGGSIDESAQYFRCGMRNLPILGVMGAVASKAATDGAAVKPWRKELLRHLRRR